MKVFSKKFSKKTQFLTIYENYTNPCQVLNEARIYKYVREASSIIRKKWSKQPHSINRSTNHLCSCSSNKAVNLPSMASLA